MKTLRNNLPTMNAEELEQRIASYKDRGDSTSLNLCLWEQRRRNSPPPKPGSKEGLLLSSMATFIIAQYLNHTSR